MENMKLQGGKLHITRHDALYEVVKGHVLVYLMPNTNEKIGRRQFLLECKEGEHIPGFYHSSELLGEWCIGFTALDYAEFRRLPGSADEETKRGFAEKLHIAYLSAEDYDEQLIEKYNMNLVKEEGYIYSTALEQEHTYEKSLRVIYEAFEKKAKNQTVEESGNRLYDTVVFLADWQDIPMASFARIKECCGRKFELADIARVSHFITREIVLEEKWYTKDAGPFLGFLAKTKRPVAIVPVRRGHYVAYDVEKKISCVITEKNADQILPNAQMFYRPFPHKEMKAKDLFFFGMKHVYKSDIVRFVCLALIGTLIGLLIPYMNEQLYDKFIPLGNQSGLIQICCVVLSCALGNVAFTIVKNLSTFRSMNAMKYAVQSATYDRLFNLPQSYLEKNDSAELAQKAMGISAVFEALSDVVIKTLLSGVFSVLYLWRMYKYSKKLANFSIVLLLIFMAWIVWMGIRQTKYESIKLEKDMESQNIMHQLLVGIAKIRIAGVENRALYEYLKPYVESRKINIRKERMTVFVNAVVGGMSTVFSMVFYYMMIKNGMELSIGAFMGFTAAFGSFSGAMLEVVTSLLQVNDVKPAYDFCKDILEQLPESVEDAAIPGNLTGEIEMNNVTFAYDEESGPVIKNLSLHVKPGEYIGLVGSSGSGKSTVLRLLLGFEKPQLGKIYYDGQDIDSLDKRELRKKFGVVLQDGGLIQGTIHENITITAPNTKLRRVHDVLKEVGLYEEVMEMPMGLHTVMAENSGTISGGQKQRILIARAIVNQPKIIFFDEATSALDNVTQSTVVESLEKIQATKIVIAHRLSTVINCDRILVLEHGELIEEGNYQELMEKRGRFYELAIRQIS